MSLERLAWRAAAILAGAGLYLAVVGTLNPWAFVQGLIVAAAALAVSRPQIASLRAGSWRHLGRIAARTARDLVAGSWKVGLTAAGLRPFPRPEWVEIEVTDPAPSHPGALALLETFSPGSYLVEHDEERGVMLFHVFDSADAERLRSDLAPALRERSSEASGTDSGGGAE